MKRYLFFIVLAVSACAMRAQDPIARAFNKANREIRFSEYVMKQREAISYLFGDRRVDRRFNWKYGIESYQKDYTADIFTRDLVIKISETSISISGAATRYMERTNLNNIIVVNNVFCSTCYATLKIRNNNVNTQIEFYEPGTNHVLQAFHIKLVPPKGKNKYPYRYPTRYRRY